MYAGIGTSVFGWKNTFYDTGIMFNKRRIFFCEMFMSEVGRMNKLKEKEKETVRLRTTTALIAEIHTKMFDKDK